MLLLSRTDFVQGDLGKETIEWATWRDMILLMHFPSWLYLIPGIYTLVIALVAGIVPTLERFKDKWTKRMYVIVLGLLFFLEFASIVHDREDLDQKHLVELGKQQERFAQTIDKLSDVNTSVQDVKQVTIKLDAARSLSNHKQTLKVTTLELSKEILTFMAEQDNAQPVLMLGSGSNQLQAKNDAIESYYLRLADWKTSSLSLFSTKFRVRISSQLELLKSQRMDISDATELCTHAVNPSMIRTCGTELAELAMKLPQ